MPFQQNKNELVAPQLKVFSLTTVVKMISGASILDRSVTTTMIPKQSSPANGKI